MWSGAAGHWLDQAELARRHLLGKLLCGLSPGPVLKKALSPSENLLKSALPTLDLEICAELAWGCCCAICGCAAVSTGAVEQPPREGSGAAYILKPFKRSGGKIYELNACCQMSPSVP